MHTPKADVCPPSSWYIYKYFWKEKRHSNFMDMLLDEESISTFMDLINIVACGDGSSRL